MQVILLEKIRRLGNIGDVVKVKDGFGRNFLIPQGKGLRATEANKKVFENKKSEFEAKNAKNRETANNLAKGLHGLTLEIISSAQVNGKLYGSITVRDIAAHLLTHGHKVLKSQVALSKPISETGIYTIQILLHPEVSSEITAVVGSTQDEINQLLSPEEVLENIDESKGFSKKKAHAKNTETEEAVDSSVESGEEMPETAMVEAEAEEKKEG